MKDHFLKAISFNLVILLVISFVLFGVIETPAIAAGENFGGYGSNGKFLAPIEAPVAGSIPISTRAELEAIKDNLSGNYHLIADIDLGGAEWSPIGTYEEPYRGHFDGQGYAIRNLTITGMDSGVFDVYSNHSVYTEYSLLGIMYGGVRNLAIEEVNIALEIHNLGAYDSYFSMTVSPIGTNRVVNPQKCTQK